MITQGKTGYWFRSLKVRPGGGKDVEKREGGKDAINHGIKDEQDKLKMISEAFMFVYISIFHLKKKLTLTYLYLTNIYSGNWADISCMRHNQL